MLVCAAGRCAPRASAAGECNFPSARPTATAPTAQRRTAVTHSTNVHSTKPPASLQGRSGGFLLLLVDLATPEPRSQLAVPAVLRRGAEGVVGQGLGRRRQVAGPTRRPHSLRTGRLRLTRHTRRLNGQIAVSSALQAAGSSTRGRGWATTGPASRRGSSGPLRAARRVLKRRRGGARGAANGDTLSLMRRLVRHVVERELADELYARVLARDGCRVILAEPDVLDRVAGGAAARLGHDTVHDDGPIGQHSLHRRRHARRGAITSRSPVSDTFTGPLISRARSAARRGTCASARPVEAVLSLSSIPSCES
eukprot:scaffold25443_cov75-Phaeocystis_antarctica.AAC.6